jgi:hypothetical protein
MKWLDRFDIAALIVPVLATVVIAAIVSVANFNIIKLLSVESTLTVLEAITTANGVLAGLLLVALTSPLDTIRRQRYEAHRRTDDAKNGKWVYNDLKKERMDIKEIHDRLNRIRRLNKSTIGLLIGVIILFSLSLFIMMIPFDLIVIDWSILILGFFTIVAFACLVPICFKLALSTIDMKGGYEDSFRAAIKRIDEALGTSEEE